MSFDIKQKLLDLSKGGSVSRLIHNRHFRKFWFGQAISLLGDQFYLIALPWLVLLITNNAIAVGTVLGLAGIPRVLLMLVGGVLTDRYSPRRIMLLSTIIRTLLVGSLTLLVMTGSIELWMLYLFALGFGIADAFFYPAQGAILPTLAEQEDWQAGNAITFGTQQVTTVIGPAIAGLIISALSNNDISTQALSSMTLEQIETTTPNLTGIGYALLLDTVSFLASIIALYWIKNGIKKYETPTEQPGMIQSLKKTVDVIWKDKLMRTIFGIIAAVEFFIVGPLLVAIPVVAKTRLVEGAAAYGLIMSSFGIGAVIGVIISAVSPKLNNKQTRTMLTIAAAVSSLGLLLLAFITNTAMCMIVTLVIGILGGYLTIYLMTWIQQRSHPAHLGKVMAFNSVLSLGLISLAQSIAGFVIDWNLNVLFFATSFAMLMVMFITNTSKSVKEM